MMAQSMPDALVLGGGPAGAALAVRLARRGRSIVLMEQSAAAHHKVCGEFLSHEAASYFDRLGIDLAALGAVPIHGVRLAAGRPIAACELPFPALSLTRRKLDESLLALAAQAGVTVWRGSRVDALDACGSGWRARLASGHSVCAHAAFLATGKHDIAGHRRPPGRQNGLVAFKMYFRLSPAQQRALDGWVELFVFPGGYAGLQLTEDSQANLCLLVTRQTLLSCGNQWPTLLNRLRSSSAALAERLDAAQPLLEKPLALSSIPYGLLSRSAPTGLWRLGDQAAVIPSFSGDGISIALHSAQLAAGLYTRGAPVHELARRLHAELRNSIGLATTISRLMVAAPALAHLARLYPPALRLIAARTRIPALYASPSA